MKTWWQVIGSMVISQRRVWHSFVEFGKAQKEQSTPRTNGGNVYHWMTEMWTIELSVPMGMLCPTHFCVFLSGYKTMQSVHLCCLLLWMMNRDAHLGGSANDVSTPKYLWWRNTIQIFLHEQPRFLFSDKKKPLFKWLAQGPFFGFGI
jgi:hypothetical protein